MQATKKCGPPVETAVHNDVSRTAPMAATCLNSSEVRGRRILMLLTAHLKRLRRVSPPETYEVRLLTTLRAACRAAPRLQHVGGRGPSIAGWGGAGTCLPAERGRWTAPTPTVVRVCPQMRNGDRMSPFFRSVCEKRDSQREF